MESNTSTRDPWSSLREKMDALDHIPGYPTPDTATLWRKIQERERASTRRRRFYQYGIAAALALVCTLLLTLTVNKQQPALQAKKADRPGVNKKQPTLVVSGPGAETVLVGATLPEKKEILQKRKKKKQPVHPTPLPKPPHKVLSDMLAQEPLNEVPKVAAAPVATTLLTVEEPLPYTHIRAYKAYRSGNPGSEPNELRRMVVRFKESKATASSPSQKIGHTVKEIQPLN